MLATKLAPSILRTTSNQMLSESEVLSNWVLVEDVVGFK